MTSFFTSKASWSVISFSIVVASKACHNVPIICTYVSETRKSSFRPCKEDYHGRYSNYNLIPIEPGVWKRHTENEASTSLGGDLPRSHQNWNPMECPFSICHQPGYVPPITYRATFGTRIKFENTWNQKMWGQASHVTILGERLHLDSLSYLVVSNFGSWKLRSTGNQCQRMMSSICVSQDSILPNFIMTNKSFNRECKLLNNT